MLQQEINKHSSSEEAHLVGNAAYLCEQRLEQTRSSKFKLAQKRGIGPLFNFMYNETFSSTCKMIV